MMSKYITTLILIYLYLITVGRTSAEELIFCEGESRTISCDNEKVLSIINGVYGRTRYSTTCGTFPPLRYCLSEADAYKIIIEKCHRKPNCSLTATNEVFGDPCKEYPKYLYVNYECAESEEVPISPSPPSIGFSIPNIDTSYGEVFSTRQTLLEKRSTQFASEMSVEMRASAPTNITNIIIICVSVIAVVVILSVLACIWYRRRIKMNSQDHETPSTSIPLESSHITPENEAIPSRNLEQNPTSQSKHLKNENEEVQAAPKHVNQQTRMLEKSGYENFQSGNFAQEEDGYLVPFRNIKKQSYGHSSKSNRNAAEVDEENGYITPETIKKQTTNMDGYEAPMKGIDVTPELDGYVQPMKFMNIRPGCNEAYVEIHCNAEECENKDHSPYAEIPI